LGEVAYARLFGTQSLLSARIALYEKGEQKEGKKRSFLEHSSRMVEKGNGKLGSWKGHLSAKKAVVHGVRA